MKLFIEPVDVWLFRDGRPFDAGSDHRAQSLFPPYPTVMQGILRSHHLVVHAIDLQDQDAIEKAVGTATAYKRLRLRGPFVARREGSKIVRYFPAPLDAAQREGTLQALVPRDKTVVGVKTSVPTSLLLWDDGPRQKHKSAQWLSNDNLVRYLDGEVVPVTNGESLFRRESRFGIGLDTTTKTTRQEAGGGLFYEVEFVRPCSNVGLDVEVDGLEGWPSTGMLRMGGEGHAGYFQPSDAAILPMPPVPLPRHFKVYFATPTYFEDGWQPRTWSRFFAGGVHPVAAAVGRYESIGGFDIAAGEHKAARRYVPAGSVYYFESEKGATVRQDLINGAITDTGAEIGFGQVIIRGWNHV
ncbi:MAG: CRISPR-associated protein Cmr3 [Anaerolineae bacterium]|nr:CRISPR-associated protein Cmr3 [Anaerolineae bacterium]